MFYFKLFWLFVEIKKLNNNNLNMKSFFLLQRALEFRLNKFRILVLNIYFYDYNGVSNEFISVMYD